MHAQIFSVQTEKDITMKSFLALSLLVLLMLAPTTGVFADQLVLANNDRISGEIISVSDGKIQVRTEYAGVIQVDFDKIANLRTERIASIVLVDGETMTGKINSISGNTILIESSDLGVVEVPRDHFKEMSFVELADAVTDETPEMPETTDQAEAAAEKPIDVPADIKPEEPSVIPKRWSGSLSAGAQLQEGNSDTTDLHFDAKAKRKTPLRELQLKFRADYGKTEGETDTNKVFGEGKYKVFRCERFYWFGVANMEHDEMEDLDLRAQVFAGPGYYFVKKERTTVLGEVGAGIIGEWTDDEDGSDETIEPGGWINLEWTQRVCEAMEFFQGLTVYPSFGDAGEYRLRSESTLKAPFGKRWSLKLSAIDEYDSNPESEDADRNDLQLITSLGYEF